MLNPSPAANINNKAVWGFDTDYHGYVRDPHGAFDYIDHIGKAEIMQKEWPQVAGTDLRAA